MGILRFFFGRLRDCFRRRSLEKELSQDIELHLEELERKYLDRGCSPEEARLAARRDFGNVTRVREDFHEQAGFPFFESLLRDLSLAFRGLSKRPVFSIGVLLILSIGLGITATVRGLTEAILLRPLPVANAAQLQLVLNPDGRPARLSRGSVERITTELGSEHVAAFSGETSFIVRIGDKPAFGASSQLVNGAFFKVLGVGIEAGRSLTSEDEQAQAPASAVVSHTWATKYFGSPQAALGQTVLVNQLHVTIVGVLPESFTSVTVGQRVHLWLPASLQLALGFQGNCDLFMASDRPNNPDWNHEERCSWLQVFLRPPSSLSVEGLTPLVLHAYQLQGEDTAKAVQDPGDRDRLLHRSFMVKPAPGGYSSFREDYRTTNALLSSFVGVFLTLACANVSGLLLVRGLSRQREIGVRIALGAKRWRICLLLGSEALLLSVGGALLGLLLAYWLIPLSGALLAPGKFLPGLALNFSLFAQTAGLALLIALACSFLPVFFLAGLQPQHAISGRGGLGHAPLALGRGLVVLQLCLAVLLTALAASLGNSLSRALAEDPGFERERVLTASFELKGAGYKEEDGNRVRLHLEEAILRIPGVESVAFATDGLVSGSQSSSRFFPRGKDIKTSQGFFQNDAVSPGYFATTGMILRKGRDFNEGDREGSRSVAIVSLAFSRQVFGVDDPVGCTLGFGPTPNSSDLNIVGVVSDARVNGLHAPPPAMVFIPCTQWARAMLRYVMVKSHGPSKDLPLRLKEAVSKAEPGLVFTDWVTLSDRLIGEVQSERSSSRLAYAFAGAALLLAATGMGALAAYVVTQRGREFAVRMAIGASPSLIRKGILIESIRLGIFGCVLGLSAVWMANLLPALSSRLPGRLDFPACACASAFCLVATLLAGWGPARKASRTDPLQLLKSE
jgi:predicted permease